MVFHPLFRIGTTADPAVKDDKRRLKIVQVKPHYIPMRLRPDRKPDPDKDRGVVIPLTGGIAIRTRYQPDPSAITQRMGGKSGSFREVTDLHGLSSHHYAREAATLGAL